MQYELTEASDLIRTMSYAGIFTDNRDCAGAIQEPIDILNRSLGYGGLVLSLTELWRAMSGLPLLDHNRVSTSWKLVDPQMFDIFQTMTGGFVASFQNTKMTA